MMRTPKPRLSRRVGWAAASMAVLAGLMLPATPAAAGTLAEDAAAAQAMSLSELLGLEGTDTANAGGGAATTYAALPAQYDLRNVNGNSLVTRVKNQSPWGTCWAFGAISAAETSILSEAYQNNPALYQYLVSEEGELDLSEHALAWFSYSPLPEDDDSGQGGEGIHPTETGSAIMNRGGWQVFATSLFSTGMGPVNESDVPYRGKNGITDYVEIPGGGRLDLNYSKDDDWSVDEEWRFQQAVQLDETYELPVPATTDGDGEYRYDASATEAIKEQLYAGRAVTIAYYADQSQPGFITETGYLNPGDNESGIWAQYTYDSIALNHAVTIVGWDDTISKEEFGNPGEDGTVDPSHQPPGDGAWIVKNSWGDGSEFPYGYVPGIRGWGTDEDKDGLGDGYFYLSYYDKSIAKAEAFDYDVDTMVDGIESYYANQYDYMPASSHATDTLQGGDEYGTKYSMANVFYTDGLEQEIRTLTCETYAQNLTTTYEVYKLEEGFTSPTDGEKILEVTDEPYRYAGFHTLDLSDDQRFVMEEGDYAFSVVVTQRGANGDYWVGYDTGYTKDVVANARDEYVKRYWDERYEYYGPFAERNVYNQKLAELTEAGVSEEDAATRAQTYVESEEGQAAIKTETERLTNEWIDAQVPKEYYEGVVNEGESFFYGVTEEGEQEWVDLAEIAKIQNQAGVAIDNFPIKAYGYEVEEKEEATAEAIKALEDSIVDGRNALLQVTVSVDGSDVDPADMWVTQDVYDAFEQALAAAEDAVSAEVPLKADIEDATAALASAREAFDAAAQPGTKAAEPATAEQLKALEDDVKTARNDLMLTAVSADGKDVATTDMWVTQAAHDEFEQAIADAEEALAAESPTASDIAAASDALADAQQTFDAAKAAGTKTDGGTGGDQGGSGSDQGGAGDNQGGSGAGQGTTTKRPAGSSVPKTGDATSLAGIIAAAGTGIAAMGAGIVTVIRRRRR